jgi:hypothetical protein
MSSGLQQYSFVASDDRDSAVLRALVRAGADHQLGQLSGRIDPKDKDISAL